jgi:putative aldouronate transport system substrate-binding protein
MRKALTEDAISETSSGFIFDDTNVKSELAAISEVCSQYIPLLELGLVDNVESTLTELNTKCETAGLEKVTEEFKAQWAAYEEGLK